ncbi:hypothetical protein A0126_13875 [Exiguobacterium sp. N4-1P]|nr:hypothetical protein A0126_13875 [Exiguobacterium sp. N4-1P]
MSASQRRFVKLLKSIHQESEIKKSLASRDSYRKKRKTTCAVRDKQDPIFCLMEAGKLACVSPEESAWKRVIFYFQIN